MAGEISIERLEQTLEVLRRHGVEFFHCDGMHIRLRRDAPEARPQTKWADVIAESLKPAAPPTPPAEDDAPKAVEGEDPDLFFSSGG